MQELNRPSKASSRATHSVQGTSWNIRSNLVAYCLEALIFFAQYTEVAAVQCTEIAAAQCTEVDVVLLAHPTQNTIHMHACS